MTTPTTPSAADQAINAGVAELRLWERSCSNWTDVERRGAVEAILAAAADSMQQGVALIAAERERQISAEGWTPEHDDEHDDGEMAVAAVCYAHFASLSDIRRNSPGTTARVLEDWPWDERWWKPGDRVRELVKAGALIAAEIDRHLRAEASERERGTGE